MSQRDDTLDAWQREVESFGGRIGAPDPVSLWDELQASNLGSQTTLPTTAAVLDLPPVVVLAEMKVSKPIAVDVSFAYFNRRPQEAGAFGDSGLSVGDGFVRVTWGIPGAVQRTVDVDGAYGWRFPFVASFLRVEYFPIGGEQNFTNGEWLIEAGQVRDLGLSAMIAPASGAPCLPLTKTIFFKEVDGAIFIATGVIPRWAKSFRFGGGFDTGATFVLNLIEGGPNPAGATLLRLISNGIAGEWPDWVSRAHSWPIPQGADFAFILPTNPTVLTKSTLICELAL